MPGLITNYLFGETLYNYLSPNYLKDLLHQNSRSFHLGLQGPDIFYYAISNRSRNSFNKNTLFKILQEKNVNELFTNMLSYIDSQIGIDKDICIAYYAGFMAHYHLATHVQSYYKDKVLSIMEDIDCKKTRKDFVFQYRQTETILDAILLKELHNLKPEQLNLEALVSLHKQEQRTITAFLQESIIKTYPSIHLKKRNVVGAIASIKRNCSYLQSNPRMHQRMITFSQKYLKYTPSITCRVYPETYDDRFDYLNNRHRLWLSKDNEPSSLTFCELFIQTKVSCNTLMELLDSYLAWGLDRNTLTKAIGDASYYIL